jgi:putative aminopeptidase FrvX
MPTSAIDYLRELVDLSGPSGAEEDVIRAIARRVRPLVDTLELDPFGNLIAVRRGAAPDARRCAIAAHMDEIGFRVRKIEEDGYLRFEKVGGSDNRVLLAQRVWVRTARGRLLGVIGTKSAHLLKDTDRASVPPHSEQYIDIGARDRADAERMGVALGDPAGFVGELAELGLGSGRYTAHALDDRAGCAILLATLDELRDRPLPVTVVALFTVQEEVGLRGAQAAIGGQSADVGLAIDTTALDDTPETATHNLRLGAGPAVKLMDASTLAHPAVRCALLRAAETAGVAAQHELLTGIGTDAGALQFGGGGVPVGTLSLGTRYTHSPIEVLDKEDLDGAVSLLREFLLTLQDADLRFTSLDD